MHASSATTHYVGVDLAKDSLAVRSATAAKTLSVQNTKQAIDA
jgi:hypothetical protein